METTATAAARLEPSRHNIVGQVHGTGSWYVVNPLSGHADVLDADEAARLQAGQADADGLFAARGYLVDPAEEDARFRRAYLDFLDDRATDEVQVFFVPWYACNFGCAYCYQGEYAPAGGLPGPDVLDAFFAYLDRHLAGRRKYLTIFGGEPLLPGDAHREVIAGLVDRAAARGMDVAVVTNGLHLVESLPILQRAKVREVQVTLDGPREVHDRRRPLRGGGATFDAIVAGVDATLEAGIPVNLRVVLDRDNLPDLPALADFAVARGWTRAPGFKTQLGRNYELHHCHAGPNVLYSRLEMYQDLFDLARRHPQVLEFHRPAYSIARYLFDNGRTPPPLFDACSGCKTEWAFDHTGRIYACTATVGKEGEALGTFWPAVALDQDAVDHWQDRDVLAIQKCRTCPVRLACGGGCASVAKNATGDLHAPDCRPIRPLLDLGVAAYLPTKE